MILCKHGNDMLFCILCETKPELNPLVQKGGKFGDNKKCKTCKHLLRVNGGSRVFSKCEQRGVTHGSATDHSMYWDACKMYKLKGQVN